jgi:hypothetical protein
MFAFFQLFESLDLRFGRNQGDLPSLQFLIQFTLGCCQRLQSGLKLQVIATMDQKIVHRHLAESFAISFVAQHSTLFVDSFDLFVQATECLVDLRHRSTRLITLATAKLK